MRALRRAIAALVLAAGAAAAWAGGVAAQPTTLHIRGQVIALEGQTLVVSAREGEPARIALAANFQVLELFPVDAALLEPGRDVGVVGERRPDGSLRTLAVLLYPRGARGTTEGHFPWDLTPQSTMTNAVIRASEPAGAGRILVVAYRAEEARIAVPPDVPLVTYRRVDRAGLRPGVNVFLTVARLDDASLTAARVMIGEGSLIPPL